MATLTGANRALAGLATEVAYSAKHASLKSTFLQSSRCSFAGACVALPPAAGYRTNARRMLVTSAAINKNKEYVVVGGGNAAGYVAKALNDAGVATGRLCIVSSEKVAPYERPALSKGYLFPLDQKPARLPGFHTTVGGGGDRQTPEWYQEKGIEFLYGTTVTDLDTGSQLLKTDSGEEIKYGNLIIATGARAIKLPEKIGGHLPGVHTLRDTADCDALIKSMESAKSAVIVGGGYIGLETAAACATWGLETTVVFPEEHVMPRLFTPAIAAHYEKLYESKGVKFVKGQTVEEFEAGPSGRVSKAVLRNGQSISADVVIVGVGAKPNAELFLKAGLQEAQGGIEVDGQFRTSKPGIFAVGDVAAFPLRILGRRARVEHVDHARKSAQHVVDALVKSRSDPYDYLPYFYSRVFEHPGSEKKLWWQFYGDNVGECVVVGNFDPKLAAFWVNGGKLKGVFLESGTAEEFALLPKIARAQPAIDSSALSEASTVEEALDIAKKAAEGQKVEEPVHAFEHNPFSG